MVPKENEFGMVEDESIVRACGGFASKWNAPLHGSRQRALLWLCCKCNALIVAVASVLLMFVSKIKSWSFYFIKLGFFACSSRRAILQSYALQRACWL